MENGLLRAVCSGEGLSRVPQLPEDVSKQVWVLGLARNAITTVSKAELQQYPLLRVLDVRQQYSTPCVDVESEEVPALVVIGEFTFTYVSSCV